MSSIIISLSKKEFTTTKGIIQKIESYVDNDGEVKNEVYVSYTDRDGNVYENILYPSYSLSMKEGDEVDVLYNPISVEEIQAPDSRYVPYIILMVGIITVIAMIIVIVKEIKKEAEVSMLENPE